MTTIYDFEVKGIDGNAVRLDAYRGQVVLIVNVASRCGFTPQYTELEALYQKYREQGLVILGFPCNQFGQQEPGDETEIKSFCSLNFGVTFPLFAKVDVNGPAADPLYQYLTHSPRPVGHAANQVELHEVSRRSPGDGCRPLLAVGKTSEARRPDPNTAGRAAGRNGLDAATLPTQSFALAAIIY